MQVINIKNETAILLSTDDDDDDDSVYSEDEVEVAVMRIMESSSPVHVNLERSNFMKLFQCNLKSHHHHQQHHHNNQNNHSKIFYSPKTSFLTEFKKKFKNLRRLKGSGYIRMSYNGVGSGGLEDPQNTQNNFPFSVRYTASPYRKSKFPASSTTTPSGGAQEAPALPPHLNIPSSSSTGNGGHPWIGLTSSVNNTNASLSSPSPSNCSGLHHQHQNQFNQNPPYIPSHQNNHYHHHPNTNSGNLQKYLIQQQEAHFAQQFHLNNPLAYQNHFVALKQHQQQQQQLLQQRQRQYDHHHYGLPVTAMPHGVILHASTTKTFIQQQGSVPNSTGNPHFQMRYPTQFARNRVFHLNSLDQVEGLDEGYIEDLKQTSQSQHLISNSGGTDTTFSSDNAEPNNINLGISNSSKGDQPNPSSSYDPYSYVYDSHIKEDLSVCSASVNQVFLNKGPSYLGNPYPYSRRVPKVVSSSENEYEEIRDVQRYMNSSYGKVLNDEEEDPTTPHVEMGPLPPKHFKSFSTSTDDILAEVVQVQQKHDRVLDQLNLEVENLLLKSSKEIAEEKDLKVESGLCPCSCNNKGCGMTMSMSNVNVPNVDDTDCNCPSCEVICNSEKEVGGRRLSKENSYSTLVVGPQIVTNNGLNDHKCSLTSGGGGGGTYGRKKKLDRMSGNTTNGPCSMGDNNCTSCCGGSITGSNMLDNNKMKLGHSHSVEESGVNKVKTRYQKTYSLIPNWKIRDHLMRLPFLKHHHDKLKKGEGRRGSIPNSISGQDFTSSTLQEHQNGGSHKLQSTNNIMTTTITEAPTALGNSNIKARSSSMDELRSTEEHWYSADSDTEPDSLTGIPASQTPLPLPPQPDEATSETCNNKLQLVNNCSTSNNSNCLTAINNQSCVNNKAPGNLYSNCGEHNGSRMEIGNGIHDNVPKAPKFRRGTGLKDKWRESWSSHSKTLLKSSQMEDDNRLLRWFSLRKNSACLDPSSNNRHSTLPQLTEEDLKRISFMDDEEGYWPRRTVQPPCLPPPPPDLSSEQITRRHIIAAIVHSENNYVAALQRLVNEYKKPLECSHPAILSHSKISNVFHRLPEILQCHSLFRIALAECVRRWDAEEKIGDVFVASFSKSLVLDVYSEFINNFGNAMETAKVEARRKSAFAEFLKVKQMTAHDRLSLFGLMVKPVQRFPQFILLLQDLLKHTPKDHHDRMSLQLALTQLESLAAMLNERKRESEQYQAFRETIKSIGGGKFVLLRSIVDDPNRILLRQDVVTQLEFDSNGGTVAKSKCRKLLLLNDMLICTTLNGSNSFTAKGDNNLARKDSCEEDSHSRGKSEKSVFKWSFPVRDVEVEDISISPTMSRFVHRGSTVGIGGLKSSGNSVTNVASEESVSITLLEEMQSLMYDYEVLSRILNLVSTLKSNYEGLTVSTVKELMLEIQHQIRCRDEQISYFDSSCLTLMLGNGTSKEKVVFQMQSPEARSAWIEELRLAQLALDPNNSPAWDIPSESPYPHHKLPLFVRALSLSKQPHLTTVKCGCFFTHTFVSKTGRSKILDYLWVSSTDGMSSHMTAYRSQQNTLKEVSAFDLVEEKVNDMVFVLGHIWVATESRKIMMYDPADPDKGNIGYHILSDSVLKLIFHNNAIYAGLADGNLAIFTQLDSPENISPEIVLTLGSDKIIALFGSREHVYAACGNSVVAIDTKTHTIERNVVLNHHNGPISHMTCSGVGLWITTQESGTVCLYHLESFQHLQDVSIAPSVYRTVRDSFRRSKGVNVTCLTAHKGWLWIGTNLGVVLTIPLPRLEGVPIISTGNANVSYHGYCGPVTFLMPLMKPTPMLPILPTTKDKTNPLKGSSEVPSEEKSLSPAHRNVNIITSPSPQKEESVRKNASVVSFSENCGSPIDVADKGSATTSGPKNSDTSNLCPSSSSLVQDDSNKELCVISNGISSDKTSSTSSIENASSPSPTSAGGNKTLVVLRKKSSKDNVFLRNCKTLPRGGPIPSNLRFSADSDVYGLYGNLINVRGLEDEGRFVDPLYDALRRSDPELNALDAKISTLDRRLKMRMSRPRSLDLSNWSVDSKISASSDESVGLGSRSSHTTDSVSSPLSDNIKYSPVPPHVNEVDASKTNGIVQETGLKNTTGTTGRNKSHGRQKAKSSKGGSQERTVLVVVGGRGYLNMRTLSQEHFITNTDSESKSCPHITLWQMKT